MVFGIAKMQAVVATVRLLQMRPFINCLIDDRDAD
jgi:hypothetical protein